MLFFAVRDAATGEFLNPFVAPSAPFAVRAFSEERVRQDSQFFKHPSDYELFELGVFDPVSGLLSPLPSPRSVIRASDVPLRPAASSSPPVQFGSPNGG